MAKESSTSFTDVLLALVAIVFSPILIIIWVTVILVFPCTQPKKFSVCMLNFTKCCFNCCCCQFDCVSRLSPDEAILRYEEDPPPRKEIILQQIAENPFITTITTLFAIDLPEYFLSILPTGSLREGFGKTLPSTAALASDFDVMLVPDAALAGEEGVMYKGNETPVFTVVEPENIEKGYVWLKLNNGYLHQWEKLCIRRQTEGGGCSYLSSHKVHDLLRDSFRKNKHILELVKRLLGSSDAAQTDVEQNGPALTVKITKSGKTWAMLGCCQDQCLVERENTLFYCDFTFALYCPAWPKKSGWFNEQRRRKWPSKEIVEQVLEIGCHIVAKPSTDQLVKLHEEQPLTTTFSKSPGLEWRFSFSQAEILLAETVHLNARSAYLALKSVNKRFISKGVLKPIPSYTLKCILLQFMEDKHPGYWNPTPEPFDIFTNLLDNLYLCLTNGSCQHYWIEEIDLFKNIDAGTLAYMKLQVEKVRAAPQEYIADNWLEHTRCLRHNCFACCGLKRNQVAPLQVIAVKDKETAACCRVPCSYSTSCCCCGPCPYDRTIMDVY